MKPISPFKPFVGPIWPDIGDAGSAAVSGDWGFATDEMGVSGGWED